MTADIALFNSDRLSSATVDALSSVRVFSVWSHAAILRSELRIPKRSLSREFLIKFDPTFS
jgi:hypothetical protein